MYSRTHSLNDKTQSTLISHISALQHAQMLVVRKEGKLHAQYNSFRSAHELLEAVSHEPNDAFGDLNEEISLQRLVQRIDHLRNGMHQKIDSMQQQMDDLKTENKILKEEIEILKEQNEKS